MRFRVLGAAVAAAAVALSVGAAQAGRVKERIYDDSFGNLIILSPSGYKRIVVGMGHIAVEMEAERRAQYSGGHEVRREHCWREPVLWKGREQMWGLADGEVPTPPLTCK
jgi:hypothetical protein